MIRVFFVDFLLPLLFFLLARSFLRSLFQGRSRPQPGERPAPPVQPANELKRDPVCGTYVSTAVSVKRTVKGEVVYYCSNQCRDKHSG